MRISFHHANPEAGNESFLLRADTGGDETPCVLVDAGDGTDAESLLGPSDSLAAICLTHAHLDHYAALPEAHRDDVPVLTSPATAAILDDVFDVAGREYDVQANQSLRDAITPVDDWVEVAPGVEVRPVPAGHVPAAVGALVRVTDGDDTRTALATGDFTRRRVAGYPGLDPEALFDVDILFLTGATTDDAETVLTDAVGTALEHAQRGATTMVTTSGLVGVQVAYLLAGVVDETSLGVPVRVVGQVAKLYDVLGYDLPGVTSVPTFDDTDACLEPGTVTVAGPEIPHERSSGRLFGVLREDPNAAVVQLVGSGKDPIREGRCVVESREFSNHPPRSTLEIVHDAVDPVQTVITHRHGGAGSEFNDLSSLVWGPGDTNEYVLYDDGWCSPPWIHGSGPRRRQDGTAGQYASDDLLASLESPSLDRHDSIDLEAEGIDVAAVTARVGRAGSEQPTKAGPEPEPAASTDGPASTDDPSPDHDAVVGDGAGAAQEVDDDEPGRASTTGDGAVGSTDDGDSPDNQPVDESAAARSSRLFQTVDAELDAAIDPAIQQAIASGDLSPGDIAAVLELSDSEAVAEGQDDATADKSNGQGATGDGADVDTGGESGAGAGAMDEDLSAEDIERGAETRESSPDPAGPSGGSTDAHDDRGTGADTAEPAPQLGTEEQDADAAAEAGQNSSTAPGDTTEPDSRSTDSDSADADRAVTSTEPRSEADARGGNASLSVRVDPLIVALASAQGPAKVPLPDALGRAIDEYARALLAGEARGTDTEFAGIEFSSPIGDAVRNAIESQAEARSVTDVLAAAIDPEAPSESVVVEVPCPETRGLLVEGAVANESYAFDSLDEVVTAAVVWQSTRQ